MEKASQRFHDAQRQLQKRLREEFVLGAKGGDAEMRGWPTAGEAAKNVVQYFVTHSATGGGCPDHLAHWSLVAPEKEGPPTPEGILRGCAGAFSRMLEEASGRSEGTAYHERAGRVGAALERVSRMDLGKPKEVAICDFDYTVMVGKLEERYRNSRLADADPETGERRAHAAAYEASGEGGGAKIVFTELCPNPVVGAGATWQDPVELDACTMLARGDTSAVFVSHEGETLLVVGRQSPVGQGLESSVTYVSQSPPGAPPRAPVGIPLDSPDAPPPSVSTRRVAMEDGRQGAFTLSKKRLIRGLASIQAGLGGEGYGQDPSTSIRVYTVNGTTTCAVAKSVWEGPDGSKSMATYYCMRSPVLREGRRMKPMYYRPWAMGCPVPAVPTLAGTIGCLSVEDGVEAMHLAGVHRHVVAKASHTLHLAAVM